MKELFEAWLDAKSRESTANAERVAIEQQIVAAVGFPDEGSKTQKLEGFKVTTGGKLTYKADMPQLTNLVEQLPPHMRPIKSEPKLDETGCKWLRTNEPNLWALIAPAIETKPAKPTVKIERINEES
ncbi:hypothetical protein HNP46_002169 [Pseudomonas nitritireducens]|uniref:Uncharacterized protein n=1 Tax=Pseudomonas nitroreducens TaxID=46680 RepID=A0A7W7KIB6_PSENT|nr:hypothetical protein [Pseudomonas nitritireducens]MBB4863322.1 hypothetical protein [Pseudomonas nitritireducens]